MNDAPVVPPSIKVLALGGLKEVGALNMTLLSYPNGNIFIIDCGMKIPTDTQLRAGVEKQIPDMSYLEDKWHRVAGLILTHAHLDHIGAMPELVVNYTSFTGKPLPILCTQYTALLVIDRLEKAGLGGFTYTRTPTGEIMFVHNGYVCIQIMKGRQKLHWLQSDVEITFIDTYHSIPGAVMVFLKSPWGNVLTTGDWNDDPTLRSTRVRVAFEYETDWELLRYLRDTYGIHLLLADSTGAVGHSGDTARVALEYTFDHLFKNAPATIWVTTFSTNPARLQLVINLTRKYGRKLCIIGRALEDTISLLVDSGYLDMEDIEEISSQDIELYEPDKVVILITGSQYERYSGLFRVAQSIGDLPKIRREDILIHSASTIPGNESGVAKLIRYFQMHGAKILNSHDDVHQSGHAARYLMEKLLRVLRPLYLVPIHGHDIFHTEHGLLATNKAGLKFYQVVYMTNGIPIRFEWEIIKGSLRFIWKKSPRVQVGVVPIYNSKALYKR